MAKERQRPQRCKPVRERAHAHTHTHTHTHMYAHMFSVRFHIFLGGPISWEISCFSKVRHVITSSTSGTVHITISASSESFSGIELHLDTLRLKGNLPRETVDAIHQIDRCLVPRLVQSKHRLQFAVGQLVSFLGHSIYNNNAPAALLPTVSP